MVRQTLFAVILEIPKDIAVPIKFLKATAHGGAAKGFAAIGGLAGAEQMTALEQVGHRMTGIFTGPGVNDAAFVVVEVSGFAAGIDQVVARKGACLIDDNALFF